MVAMRYRKYTEQRLSVALQLCLGQSASLHRCTTWVHRKTNSLVYFVIVFFLFVCFKIIIITCNVIVISHCRHGKKREQCKITADLLVFDFIVGLI